MARLRDYIGFAVWFAGLGYMAIWLLAWRSLGGALPPSLHMLGAFLALAVAVQGVYVMLRRARRRRASAAPPHDARSPRTPARCRENCCSTACRE